MSPLTEDYIHGIATSICPDEWKLPSNNDWSTLGNYINDANNIGNKLKAQSGWGSCCSGTDEYGFAALPGGYRKIWGDFTRKETQGYWWTATDSYSNAYHRILYYDADYMTSGKEGKGRGLSVRCIKGENNSNNLATVATDEASSIGDTYATLNGDILSNGGAIIEQKGFYWSDTNSNPDKDDNALSVGTDDGTFKLDLTELEPNTTYYFHAFAMNSNGTALGDIKSLKTDDIKIPVINSEITQEPTVSETEVTLFGNITSDGGYPIIQRGFYWSETNENPDENDNVEIVDGTFGEFSAKLTNLTPGTTYFYRVFATNSSGTAISDVQSCTTSGTSISYGTLTDSRDGNTYKTVKIGTQEWITKNLEYDIGNGCLAYNNDESNVATYGRLYTWEVAKTSCPNGWHLPSDDEWEKLELAIGMSISEIKKEEWRGTTEGTKLKATHGWNENKNGTDDFGFEGLPGGFHNSSYFAAIGTGCFWWSATPVLENEAWSRRLGINSTLFGRYSSIKDVEFSIRCIKN